MIDYSVYPDVDELPLGFDTIEDQADYIARICGAWDFGVVPTQETFALFSAWRKVFDRFPLLHSPAYAAFRSWFGWRSIPGGSILRANYEQRDQRPQDVCLELTLPLPTFALQNMESFQPQRPANPDPIADAILEQLRDYPEARYLVLGGHFALKCYLDYRQTHDIDAWWAQETPEAEQQLTVERLRSIMLGVSEANGLRLDERITRSMISLEMKRDRNTVFSVQIAERDVELEPPILSPWSPVLIETLRDNIGSKMNALVNRGAPRDFTDVRAVIVSGLATVEEVWEVWQQKNPNLDQTEAKFQVLNHLESIALRRPIDRLPVEQRAETAAARQWFREALLSCSPVQEIDQDGFER